jgi:hypothetical protein
MRHSTVRLSTIDECRSWTNFFTPMKPSMGSSQTRRSLLQAGARARGRSWSEAMEVQSAREGSVERPREAAEC